MRANPSRDTGPELRLRRKLHAAGLRYRVNYAIRVDDGRRTSPDIAFTRAKLAVFVDGCFWHSCPEHGSVPKTNSHYWPAKLRRNVERDQETTRRLQLAGWEVVRCWEHESPHVVAMRIAPLAKRQTQINSRPTFRT
ncbi:MAG: very short patch repair endonuclease [Candidatus Dormiibacterota bacterium]